MTITHNDHGDGNGLSHGHPDGAAHTAPWLDTELRTLDLDTRGRFEGYLAEIFTTLGMDLESPGTADTPSRFLQAMFDATDGYEGDPKLVTVFPTECHGDTPS